MKNMGKKISSCFFRVKNSTTLNVSHGPSWSGCCHMDATLGNPRNFCLEVWSSEVHVWRGKGIDRNSRVYNTHVYNIYTVYITW